MVSKRLLVIVVLATLLVLAGVVAVGGAQERALRAEETYVASHLDGAACLDDWGTRQGTVTERASVTGLSPLGVRVRVTMPYAYLVTVDGETVFADTSSDAVYAVSVFGTRRMRGDDIAPC